MVDFDMLRHVAAKGLQSDRIFEADAWLRTALAAIPPGESWTTRQLISAIGADDRPPADKKILSQALWQMRRHNLLDDCFTTDNRRRYMGNPLIVWHRPGDLA